MEYVRYYHVKCDSCGETHNLAVQSPARAQRNYEFTCPDTESRVILRGPPKVAATQVVYSVPEDCIEAKDCGPA